MPLRTAVLLLLTLTLPCLAQDYLAVTPYRPSVSSPAQLPAVGQLELELGGLRSRAGDGRRDSVPLALKLAFSPVWGMVLAGEALVLAPDGSGRHRSGVGDTVLVLKHALPLDQATVLGLELGTKLPSARAGVGSGQTDYSVNGILSHDMGPLHLDANLNLTRLGVAEAGSGRTQAGISAAFALPLAARWGLSWEWSGSQRAGAARSSQLLVAVSYSPTPLLTIDAGVAHGLGGGTPDWSLFTGLVFPLAKLW